MIFQVCPVEWYIATINARPARVRATDAQHVQTGWTHGRARPSAVSHKGMQHLVRLDSGERVDRPVVPLVGTVQCTTCVLRGDEYSS